MSVGMLVRYRGELVRILALSEHHAQIKYKGRGLRWVPFARLEAL